MPAPRRPERRGPTHAGRPVRPPRRRRVDAQPLAVTAAWTGVVAALVASVASIAVVAVVWLPASAGSGSAGSAIRAGIITFLAGVHGGVTVDGVPTAFVPLGITLAVIALSWRAGVAIAEVANEHDERRAGVLAGAVAAQSAGFALACAVLAAAATLGTSSASVPGAFVAGFLLSAAAGGTAVARHSQLGDDLRAAQPVWLVAGARCAVAALGVHLAAGALLVAGSVIVHHERVVDLSTQVGGGWSGVPVLLLGVLAAPNAVIAGSGYLSGAGFAVGSGTSVGLTAHTTGTVPAFPLLGALPEGDGAAWPVWVFAAVAAVLAGAALAVTARRAETRAACWRDLGVGVAVLAVAGGILAWQGGGGIGSGRLHAVGVSPWQYPLALALVVGGAGGLLLGLDAGLGAARGRDGEERPTLRQTIAALATVEDYDTEDLDDVEASDDDTREGGKLAG